MRKYFIFLIYFFFCFNLFAQEKPPAAPIEEVTDEYHGVKITDPYRYMEDLEDVRVKSWFKSQADYTRRILDSISGRKAMFDRMKELDERESEYISSLKITGNDRYFYKKLSVGDEQAKLFYRDGYSGKEIMLFDPETHNTESGKNYSVSSFSPSWDGKKITFEVSEDGTEQATMYIMDVDNKRFYPETIDRCWLSSPSWLPDNNRFLYNRLKSDDIHRDDFLLDSKGLLHTVGTSPLEDKEIFSREKYPELNIGREEFPIVVIDSEFDEYVFAFPATVDKFENFYYTPISDMEKEKIPWKTLTSKDDQVTGFCIQGDDLYLKSAKNASNYQIIKTKMKNPDLSDAEVVVPETDEVLGNYELTEDALYFVKTRNGVDARFYRYELNTGQIKQIELPVQAGRATLSSKGPYYPDVWVTVAGWTTDDKRFRFNPAKGDFIEEPMYKNAEYPEFSNFKAEELVISSHDSAQVPLSVIYKKETSLDGNNPLLMTGYGAYGSIYRPFFSPILYSWILDGGIVAFAHVRGGGEKGDAWHKGGFKTTKSNTWKDFIACAEYLIDKRYTSSEKLAIMGGSAGGILIGRSITERPDLFAAATALVGSMNAVRFEETPNGPGNVAEFGTIKDPDEFKALLEMDAFHHIKDGEKYPATLITAGLNDPRVIAWVPGKFAARLQVANASDKPVLFKVSYDIGHGHGSSRTQWLNEYTDVFSFFMWQLGHPAYQLKTKKIDQNF